MQLHRQAADSSGASVNCFHFHKLIFSFPAGSVSDINPITVDTSIFSPRSRKINQFGSPVDSRQSPIDNYCLRPDKKVVAPEGKYVGSWKVDTGKLHVCSPLHVSPMCLHPCPRGFNDCQSPTVRKNCVSGS